MLTIAALIMLLTGIAHSFLGEKYILMRLFRRDNIPELLGSDEFTKNTLRFTWHITSIAWFGLAAVMYFENSPSPLFLYTVATISFSSAAVAAFFTRGKHLSWIAFLMVGILTLLSIK
jgi:hypothetical protein